MDIVVITVSKYPYNFLSDKQSNDFTHFYQLDISEYFCRLKPPPLYYFTYLLQVY